MKDINTYWQLLQEYKNAKSDAARTFIIGIKMAQFLTTCTNEKVSNLLTSFIEKEKSNV